MSMYDSPTMVKLPRLRDVRMRAALSQEELAAKAGTTRVTISRLETEQQEPQPRTLRRLAQALGVSPSDLMAPLP